ncbi:hypothetical protein H9Q73_003265 [Fusarium xylarioides]|nr:hypothetical protein H9Q73_003265 [Fusarium xylarioides]
METTGQVLIALFNVTVKGTVERAEKARHDALEEIEKFNKSQLNQDLEDLANELKLLLKKKTMKLKDDDHQAAKDFEAACDEFKDAWEAAWNKQDDDLFNTARLITCGMYIQISVHDYLRALMGFHQFNTNFTLDPRADFDQKKTSHGIGNQVTVEFNLLYRFHCAISLKDEKYTEDFMKNVLHFKDPSNTSLPEFLGTMDAIKKKAAQDHKYGKREPEPWEVTFGIPDDKDKAPSNGAGSSGNTSDSGIALKGASSTVGPEKVTKSKHFTRNAITNLFDDNQMLEELTSAMDDPISNFGPRNVPKCLKSVEIMGILQARRWECGTLNDFRDFFGLPRHQSFESVTKNVEIQNALRDLYEHPDKIELYPGIFCESDEYMGLDPGPSESSSALWSAIFSDAITLVRSDRFYTVDWNTNSLTSWGMKEVTPNNEICKSSVFHRLIQRAFPGWFPSNTVRFFYPFYTAKQNGIYAEAQGYGDWFKETVDHPEVTVAAPVQKPEKPWYLSKFDDIKIILQGDKAKNFTNPAYFYKENLPQVFKDVLTTVEGKKDPKYTPTIDDYVTDVEADLKKYLDGIMREIVKRESISMTNSTFQIDATRDFAIPVDTYSENEIYQHITNCQIFLSYNADETKWLQCREAFKASMKKLIELTQRGTIWEAGQWDITRALLVVSFTATLDGYMKDLYAAADGRPHLMLGLRNDIGGPQWIQVQKCVFSDKPNADGDLEKMVQTMARITVRQPIVRKALAKDNYSFAGVEGGKQVTIKEGEAVILDLAKAGDEEEVKKDAEKRELLMSQLSIADKFGVFAPRRVVTISLTSMIKFVAQMKNPRRGHDAQGKLKKINLDSTPEGYANYMAPGRVSWIQQQAKKLKGPGEAEDIVTKGNLRPETDTYLTLTWDEFVPFPMTWKIRFDGFGESDYKVGTNDYGRVKTMPTLPDYCSPWYQP